MPKSFHLEIIASDRVFFEGDCEHLVVTALDGLLGILAGHEPLVTSLMEVMPDFAVILADSCELPEEIDIKRAEEAKMRAEEKLRHKQSIMEYYHTQVALNKAMNRLKVSQKHFK